MPSLLPQHDDVVTATVVHLVDHSAPQITPMVLDRPAFPVVDKTGEDLGHDVLGLGAVVAEQVGKTECLGEVAAVEVGEILGPRQL